MVRKQWPGADAIRGLPCPQESVRGGSGWRDSGDGDERREFRAGLLVEKWLCWGA